MFRRLRYWGFDSRCPSSAQENRRVGTGWKRLRRNVCWKHWKSELCTYIYIYIYNIHIYIYICIYIYVYIYMYIHIEVCVCRAYTHTYIYIYIYHVHTSENRNSNMGWGLGLEARSVKMLSLGRGDAGECCGSLGGRLQT